ncbi:hypothetical protein [Candidatus Rariloculus sp.]|uniref:hypothetical protein n=1 Tax=Candidatus Rariloculus sp. TaxID=3101265 RepID=UPI003D0BFEBF
MPLLRLHGERIYAESRVDVIAPNMFAGSVLDLEPDTEYEVRFVMSDPDGVHGTAERVLVVSTRAEPEPWTGGRVLSRLPARTRRPGGEEFTTMPGGSSWP